MRDGREYAYMELSADLLQSTVSHLKSDQVEQRRSPRAPLRMRVKIAPYENGTLGDPLDVWTLDLSEGGIGVLSPKPMRAGRKFVIRMSQLDDSPHYLLCTVRNCAALTQTLFRLGASFAEVAGAPKHAKAMPPADHSFFQAVKQRLQAPALAKSQPSSVQTVNSAKAESEINRLKDAILF